MVISPLTSWGFSSPQNQQHNSKCLENMQTNGYHQGAFLWTQRPIYIVLRVLPCPGFELRINWSHIAIDAGYTLAVIGYSTIILFLFSYPHACISTHLSIWSTQHGRHSCQFFVVLQIHSMTVYLNHLLTSHEPLDQNQNASSKFNVTANVIQPFRY